MVSGASSDVITINLADQPEFDLGGATVKPAERIVVFNDTRHELQPRVMQVLVALARARPAVLSRDRLADLCWDGRVVGDDALNRCILALRHLSQQLTPQPFTIVTVPRVGHRLVETGRLRAGSHQPRFPRRALLAGGIGIAAVTAAGGWYLSRPAPSNRKRIAVLPFANLSGDQDQAYFAEGVAEELRSALSRIGMEVVGRTSSDAVMGLDAKSAAAKLGVAHILTGSVRRSPRLIRINAQLVSGTDGVERWAQTYDRQPGDEIGIQTDIAESVARALSITLGAAVRAALTLGGTADNVAFDLVMQSRTLGRAASTAEAIRRRIALADAAIVRDPRYADAYVEKANALFGFSITYAQSPAEVAEKLGQADAAARTAVALAPRLGSAHIALAQIGHGRLDFRSAFRHARVALGLSPQDPDVLAYGSRYLAYFGGAEQGLTLSQRAIELDPLNGRAYALKCAVLIMLRQFAPAVEASRDALALAPELFSARVLLGDALLLLGRPVEAKAEYEAIGPNNPFRLARLSLLAARAGDRTEAERMMTRLNRQMGAAASFQNAEIYAQIGDRNRAFAELEKAFRARDSGLAYLGMDPLLDPIRGDRRYPALLDRLNFPSSG